METRTQRAASSLQPELRALVVDDEPSVRLALRYAMEDEGWVVSVADSATRALELVPLTDPHVIVADKNMPGMSGVELLRRVRTGSEHSDVAFVLMTAYASLQSVHDAMELDVDGYVEKPFRDVFETLAMIRGALDRRHGRAELRAARMPLRPRRQPSKDHHQLTRGSRVGVSIDDPALRERLVRLPEIGAACGAGLPASLPERGRELEAFGLGGGTPRDGRFSRTASGKQSSDAPDLWVTDEANLHSVVRNHPDAMVAVVADTTKLSVLIGLLDAGASTVLDPKLGDDDLERLTSLIRRASWDAR